MVNYLDLAIAAALAFFFIRGMFRGFFLEAASIAGLVLAFYLANSHHPELASFFKRWIQDPDLNHAVSYSVLFLGVMAGVSILARFIAALFNVSPARWLSVTGGGTLGLLKGLGMVLAALAMLNAYTPDAVFLKESLAAKYLGPAVERVREYLPEAASAIDSDTVMRSMEQLKTRAMEKFLDSGPDKQRDILERYAGSDPEKQKAMEKFLALDRDEQKELLENFMDSEPGVRREIIDKYKR